MKQTRTQDAQENITRL